MGDEEPRALGPYFIVSRLATGGMAELFLGKRTGPNGFERPVAVKRILPHLARQPAFVAMFLDEARIAARVNHRNVVKVEDLGQDGGELYMAMEYLAGVTVSRLMKHVASRGTGLPAAVAVHIAACVAAGLHAAHQMVDEQGVPLQLVHRDVSPDNVFLTFDGEVKLLDFGVAKVRDGLTRTQTGEVKGKAAYMSPEQCCAQPLDPRSDVYSLGVVLHEMLTGRRLFGQGNAVATMHAVLEQPIAAPSALCACPPELDAICLKALARSRDDRYPSALELGNALATLLPSLGPPPEEALRSLLKGDFVAVEQQSNKLLSLVTAATTKGSPSSRPPRRWLGPAVAAAVAVIAGAALVAATRPAPPESAPVEVTSPLPPPPPQVAEVPSVAEQVAVTVITTPPGARLAVDGVSRGVTPITLELPKNDAELALVLERDGYAPLKRTLRARVDQELTLALERLPPRPARKAATPRPAIHRFE